MRSYKYLDDILLGINPFAYPIFGNGVYIKAQNGKDNRVDYRTISDDILIPKEELFGTPDNPIQLEGVTITPTSAREELYRNLPIDMSKLNDNNVLNSIPRSPNNPLHINPYAQIAPREDNIMDLITEVLDPTGVTSWRHLVEPNPGVLDYLSAVPLAGIAGKAGKIIKKVPKLFKNVYKVNPFALKEQPYEMLIRAKAINQKVDFNMASAILERKKLGEPLNWIEEIIINGSNPQIVAREKAHGRWFESDPKRLDYYLDPTKNNFDPEDELEILKQVFPKKDVEKFKLKNIEDKDIKRLSVSHNTEYLLPKELINKTVSHPVEDWQKIINEHNTYFKPHWLKGYKPLDNSVDFIKQYGGKIKTQSGTRVTHKLAAETPDGKNWYVFPTVDYQDGKWKIFKDNLEAFEYHKNKGTLLPMPDKETAIMYSENGLINHNPDGITGPWQELFNEINIQNKHLDWIERGLNPNAPYLIEGVDYRNGGKVKAQYGGHGYEDLFNAYMSELENNQIEQPSSEKTVEDEVDEYFKNLDGKSDDVEDKEIQSFLDQSLIESFKENFDSKLNEIEEKLLLLDMYNSNDLYRKYDYGVEDEGDFSNVMGNGTVATNVNPVSSNSVAHSGQGKYNAGNVRDVTTGKFRNFNSPEEGYQALVYQLMLYQTGKTKTGVKPNWTLLQAMNKYAPSSDNNNPNHYAKTIANRMGISVNTPISQIDTYKWADEVAKFEGNRTYLNSGHRKKQYGGEDDYNTLFHSIVDELGKSALSYANQEGNNSNQIEEEEFVNPLTNEDNSENSSIFAQSLYDLESYYNDRLDQLNTLLDDYMVFDTPQNTQRMQQNYEYGKPPEEQQQEVPNYQVDMSKINFKSSGKHGVKNIGQKGIEIGNTVAEMLGYTPTYNSIYRDKKQQDYYIKKGSGAKNSYHLTGNAIDVKPSDWNNLTSKQKQYLRNNYDVIYHDNHYHIEPK